MTRRFDHAFQAPVPHPNGLQATDEGLWIADQDQGRAFLVAPDDGTVIRSFATGAGKSSGVTFGHGALWMCSNGLPKTRPPTAIDTAHTRIVTKPIHIQGAMLAQFRAPGDSDVHGLEWDRRGPVAHDAGSARPDAGLTPNRWRRAVLFPCPWTAPTGWAGTGRRYGAPSPPIERRWRLSARDGAVLERLNLAGEPFEPHGLTLRQGRLWICDAVTGAVWRQREPDAASPADDEGAGR